MYDQDWPRPTFSHIPWVDLPCSNAERGGFFSLNKDVLGSSLAQKVMSSCSIWLSHVQDNRGPLTFLQLDPGMWYNFSWNLANLLQPQYNAYTYVYLFVYNGCWLDSWLIAICYVVKGPLAAMSREIKLNTLQGSVITLDVPMTATVRELKMMLLEKHPCQDPIERKVLKVELLRDSSIIDDAESLDEAGLVRAESPVTVTYVRNEVEAVEQDDIHAHGYFGVKIPSNVTNISNAAFKDLHELVLVTIPESVTHIGECAFQDCDSLASITLGESVTDIGEGAFAGCTSLASITLGESVTHIGSGAFQGCTSLARISLGESVTDIGQFTFYQCTSLASITLGESVTNIGESAFEDCTSLASITLGASVTHIGHAAFGYCTSLTSIAFGQSVTDIGDCAFEGCTSLASITLGDSVTNIGESAFQDCSSLANITLGESVTHIGEDAFEGCTSLASITLPESVEHILVGVFRDNPVAIITIPAKQGRKRLRNEWMSVQCTESVMGRGILVLGDEGIT